MKRKENKGHTTCQSYSCQLSASFPDPLVQCSFQILEQTCEFALAFTMFPQCPFIHLYVSMLTQLPYFQTGLPPSPSPHALYPLLILHYAVRNEGRVQGGGPQNHTFESHCRFKPCEKPKATYRQTLSPAERQGPEHLLCLCPLGCSFSCHPAISKSPKVRVI